MRYFIVLSYLGRGFSGWQKQPHSHSVQEAIEQALTILLKSPIEITGCGRTDTGVHASHYVAHFDSEGELPPNVLSGVNSLLPANIAIQHIVPMHVDAHARFDATERSYIYHLHTQKDPFLQRTSWHFTHKIPLQLEVLNETASIFLQYDAFFPFCKTNSGIDHYRCKMLECKWIQGAKPYQYEFHVSANRFLRGMIRLMVGACVQVSLGKITNQDVITALEQQTHLHKSLSVPPDGLFLSKIKYPYPIGG